jgi:hypothetical protein
LNVGFLKALLQHPQWSVLQKDAPTANAPECASISMIASNRKSCHYKLLVGRFRRKRGIENPKNEERTCKGEFSLVTLLAGIRCKYGRAQI